MKRFLCYIHAWICIRFVGIDSANSWHGSIYNRKASNKNQMRMKPTLKCQYVQCYWAVAGVESFYTRKNDQFEIATAIVCEWRCLLYQRKRCAWLLTIHIVWPSNSVLLRFTFHVVHSLRFCWFNWLFRRFSFCFYFFCFVLLIFFTFPLFGWFFICWSYILLLAITNWEVLFLLLFIHLFEMVGNGWRAMKCTS